MSGGTCHKASGECSNVVVCCRMQIQCVPSIRLLAVLLCFSVLSCRLFFNCAQLRFSAVDLGGKVGHCSGYLFGIQSTSQPEYAQFKETKTTWTEALEVESLSVLVSSIIGISDSLPALHSEETQHCAGVKPRTIQLITSTAHLVNIDKVRSKCCRPWLKL